MGYMVVRAEETKRVFIDEIAVLVIENPAVSFTGCLMEMLIAKKIKVIFCDSKRNPVAELVSYHGSYDSSLKIKTQISWDNTVKEAVWAEIVAEKIRKQAEFLKDLEYIKERTCSAYDHVDLLILVWYNYEEDRLCLSSFLRLKVQCFTVRRLFF